MKCWSERAVILFISFLLLTTLTVRSVRIQTKYIEACICRASHVTCSPQYLEPIWYTSYPGVSRTLKFSVEGSCSVIPSTVSILAHMQLNRSHTYIFERSDETYHVFLIGAWRPQGRRTSSPMNRPLPPPPTNRFSERNTCCNFYHRAVRTTKFFRGIVTMKWCCCCVKFDDAKRAESRQGPALEGRNSPVFAKRFWKGNK